MKQKKIVRCLIIMITIKNKAELDIMKKAGEIVALAHEIVKEKAKPGVTTKELDKIAEEVIRKHNAIPSFKGYEGLPGAMNFPSSICASLNEEVVHGIPSNRVLKVKKSCITFKNPLNGFLFLKKIIQKVFIYDE